MTFVRKEYRQITDSMLSQITRGVIEEKFEHTAGRTKYRLAYPDVVDILRVEGTLKSSPFTFRKGTDYRLSGSMIEWLRDGEKPASKTTFTVFYRIDVPMGITDVNPGSVARTLIESIALEMDYLNAQMRQVYDSGFIDTATGKSLDLVVSILGISRKMAGYASGEVTFGRKREPAEVSVSREAHVYDGKSRYELKNSLVKGVKAAEGTTDGGKAAYAQGRDFEVRNGAILWLPGGKKPDLNTVFYVDYSAYEKIVIPLDTRVSTYSRRAENVKVFRTVREVTLAKNPDGRWEADVPVMALVPGKEGNVFAGSINIMPRPVTGIEYVINKKDILNGTDVETDSELRDRGRRALEVAGKATLRSLKSAVEGVDGVVGEVVVIDQPDGVPGVMQIIASGGDDEEIARVIDETRAAGILVEFKRPSLTPLDLKLTLVVRQDLDRSEVRDKADRQIREYVGRINIGEPVLISGIIRAALAVEGVRDARGVTINDRSENAEVRSDEKCELRTLEIYVED
ncbi:baseplate J/gp47 family protein [Methanocella arvoryzae]|uniref:Uncharacterized protein n=1 Tax=Methanocella arvoryzae (strain DSM 22066 / NBRC 105507 / MRE50) TaxID=351160 RepID=Q0W3Z3_METAR|nr:baseplate J/gp47 family protein [Methanocella arvoryzae]CAJ36900.1 hypothetical protein RCIX1676 [Methanocella arvoryzae MRE50]